MLNFGVMFFIDMILIKNACIPCISYKNKTIFLDSLMKRQFLRVYSMGFNCSVGEVLVILCSFPSLLTCELHTTGYIYQLIHGDGEQSHLCSEMLSAYYDCWQSGDCNYVAMEEKTGKFSTLTSKKGLNKSKFSSIWKKRMEGKRYHQFGHSINTATIFIILSFKACR